MTDWRARGACRGVGPAAFYEDDPTEALAICAPCPVKAACLDYALTAPEFRGVWGGRTETERRTIRRNRGLGVKSSAIAGPRDSDVLRARGEA